ncbi:MAG: OmpA family protein [Gemmatimonadaceae bacterium]|nr:OmpA family protein [Gemmatimonadaceae bacterium]
MRRSATIPLMLLALATYTVPASAQIFTNVPDEGLSGAKEFGLFPTGRILSTEYSVEDGRAAFGGTVTAAAHLKRFLAVQGGLGVAYSRQEFTYYRPPLVTFTPTLSLILQRSTAADFQPYALAGVGYEFVRYTRPRCDCEQSKSLGIGHVGGGFRRMIGARRALRAEVSSQIGKGGPAFSGFAGVSFFVGGPADLIRKSRPRPPGRVRTEPPMRMPPRTGQPIAVPQRTTTSAPRPTPAAPPPAPVAPSPNAGAVLLTIDGTQVDFSKPAWRNEAETMLDGLVVDLTSDAGEGIKLSIEAHTDNIGSNAANITLGLDRARAVREYLLSQGVTAERIRISSAGEDSPIASNTTALGRQQNRRIVIRREN